MALPQFFMLKSNYNNKYLRYINEDVEVHGLLQFSGEDILSPFGEYEVEMAKCGNGLVHVRCCYNNKYWVRSSRDHCWIVARANEPDENATKWCCTLFEPVYVDTNAETVRFCHVQLGCYACLWRASDPPYNSCLYAGSKEPDNNEQCDVCTITDWILLLVLPKYIAFKGDNGKFLSVKEGHPYLNFASTDIADPKVWNEVFANHDGSVCIKSNYLRKFWKLSPDSNGIWADADDSTPENFDTWFWPVKVEDKVIALQNLGNKNFCKRHTVETEMSSLSFRPNEEEENYLTAAVSAITSEAKLEVCDLAVSRNIDNVTFRPMDARIYGQTVIIIASEKVVNGDPTNPITVNLNLTKTVTRSRTWNASTSLKLGVETKIQTMVPSITDGVIKLSGEFNGLYQWGRTETESIKLGSDHQVIVPPKSAMKVSMLVTEGLCNVPFSYTQCDTLINGKQIRCRMDDGIFTGNSFFDLKFEARPENL